MRLMFVVLLVWWSGVGLADLTINVPNARLSEGVATFAAKPGNKACLPSEGSLQSCLFVSQDGTVWIEDDINSRYEIEVVGAPVRNFDMHDLSKSNLVAMSESRMQEPHQGGGGGGGKTDNREGIIHFSLGDLNVNIGNGNANGPKELPKEVSPADKREEKRENCTDCHKSNHHQDKMQKQ